MRQPKLERDTTPMKTLKPYKNTQTRAQRSTAILRRNIKSDMTHLEDWQIMLFTWHDGKGAAYAGKLMDNETQCGVSAFAGAVAVAKTWHQIKYESKQAFQALPIRWR